MGRGVVRVEPGVSPNPPLHLFGRVSAEVVQDDMHVVLGGGLSVQGSQEGEELLVPMPMAELSDHLPVRISSAARGRWSHCVCIDGSPLREPRPQVEGSLLPLQSLDLGLLIHAAHDRLLGRVQVEAHNVRELLFEAGIVAELEGPATMGLKTMGLPYPVHGHVADPKVIAQGPSGPLGLSREGENGAWCARLLDESRGDGGVRARARRVLTDPSTRRRANRWRQRPTVFGRVSNRRQSPGSGGPQPPEGRYGPGARDGVGGSTRDDDSSPPCSSGARTIGRATRMGPPCTTQRIYYLQLVFLGTRTRGFVAELR